MEWVQTGIHKASYRLPGKKPDRGHLRNVEVWKSPLEDWCPERGIISCRSAKQNLGTLLSRMNRYAEAIAVQREAIAGFHAAGDSIMEAASRAYLAMVYRLTNAKDEAYQEAEIKVATFNFTRYGLLNGRVLTVSQDAIGHDDPQEQTRDRAQGGVYNAQLSRAGTLDGTAFISNSFLVQCPRSRPHWRRLPV